MSRVLVGLLRGINVGGRHSLPMKTLVEVLDSLGAEAVRTYIQSGNVVFRTRARDLAALSGRITHALEPRCGFAPMVWLMERDAFAEAAGRNPFPEAEQAPKTLHLGFCEDEPDAMAAIRLEALRTDSERFAIRGRVLYLHTPDGLGRSKLAAATGRALATSLTMRNWSTVQRLLVMAAEASEAD